LTFYWDNDLLVTDPICDCGREMKLISWDPDGNKRIPYRWECPDSKHRIRFTLLKYSWFEGMKISPRVALELIYMWTKDVSVKFASEELELSENSISEWFGRCRELVVLDMLEGLESGSGNTNELPEDEKLGGKNRIVEMDEAKFGKSKYHRGTYRDGIWVIGIVDRVTGMIYLQPVESRNEQTCVWVSKRYIKENSFVFTDMWGGYTNLNDHGFNHYDVNHERHFVALNHVHTNTIEGAWMHIKKFLPTCSHEKKSEYFVEFCWRKKMKIQARNLFSETISIIAKYFLHYFRSYFGIRFRITVRIKLRIIHTVFLQHHTQLTQL
jgi:transposase-like protein